MKRNTAGDVNTAESMDVACYSLLLTGRGKLDHPPSVGLGLIRPSVRCDRCKVAVPSQAPQASVSSQRAAVLQCAADSSEFSRRPHGATWSKQPSGAACLGDRRAVSPASVCLGAAAPAQMGLVGVTRVTRISDVQIKQNKASPVSQNRRTSSPPSESL